MDVHQLLTRVPPFRHQACRTHLGHGPSTICSAQLFPASGLRVWTLVRVVLPFLYLPISNIFYLVASLFLCVTSVCFPFLLSLRVLSESFAESFTESFAVYSILICFTSFVFLCFTFLFILLFL